MTRRRSFCRYCGAMTPNRDSCCAAHRDLLRAERDLIPPDPCETIPVMATEARRERRIICQACDGAGILFPEVDCDNCNGTGTAPRREATRATRETGA